LLAPSLETSLTKGLSRRLSHPLTRDGTPYAFPLGENSSVPPKKREAPLKQQGLVPTALLSFICLILGGAPAAHAQLDTQPFVPDPEQYTYGTPTYDTSTPPGTYEEEVYVTDQSGTKFRVKCTRTFENLVDGGCQSCVGYIRTYSFDGGCYTGTGFKSYRDGASIKNSGTTACESVTTDACVSFSGSFKNYCRTIHEYCAK
jgi:hypothetical protein